MTYGEAHVVAKLSIYMEDGVFKTKPLPFCEPQMSKKDAAIYYSEKCRRIFLDLGFEYKMFDTFEKRLDIAFFEVRSDTNRMLKREVQNILIELGM